MGVQAETDLDSLARIVVDPVDFCEVLLGVSMWRKQADIARAVARCSRVAVKAGHASGKTWLAARIALWWLVRWRGLVITTAPTWYQVRLLLWSEIQKAVLEAQVVGRIQFPEPNQTELRLGPTNYAIGISTNEGVRFQGFHGEKILVILDEAPGVRPDIWEAIEGARSGGDVRVLAMGNPTIPGGPFYDAFTANRDGWETFTIRAFDTPNFDGLGIDELLALDEDALDTNVRPYLTTRRWVKERYYEAGPASPYWQARVMGEFPMQADDALISLAWAEAAAAREAAPLPEASPHLDGDVVAGIDVAGPGEAETVLVVRHGPHVLLERAWQIPDAQGEVIAALQPWRHRIRSVNVDAAGIGYGFATWLRDIGKLPVRYINVGEAPTDGEKFRNLKAELYWGLRQRFQDGAVSGALSPLMVSQLASLKYKHNARGQVEIEKKEDAVKRGIRSPDRAEALMLAFAGEGGEVVVAEQPRRPPLRIPRLAMEA